MKYTKPGELEINLLDRFISENMRLTPLLPTPVLADFNFSNGWKMNGIYVEAHHKGVLQPVSFWWKYLSLKLLGSKLTFPICWTAGYKGCERVVKAGKYKNKHFKNRFYLWLLPFSKDSSSSSLLSRSLLFMKGNFLLKLIFCFALGPRLRVPVDLHKEGSFLFDEIGLTKQTILRIEKAWHCVFHWNPLSFDESCILKLWMHARAWHS